MSKAFTTDHAIAVLDQINWDTNVHHMTLKKAVRDATGSSIKDFGLNTAEITQVLTTVKDMQTTNETVTEKIQKNAKKVAKKANANAKKVEAEIAKGTKAKAKKAAKKIIKERKPRTRKAVPTEKQAFDALRSKYGKKVNRIEEFNSETGKAVRVIINCQECGAERNIATQDLFQVNYCLSCAKKVRRQRTAAARRTRRGKKSTK